MKSRRYAAVFLLVGASVAALLTPLGPWAMLRLGAPLMAPWTLHVREVSGSLWSGVTLRDANLFNEALRVRLRRRCQKAAAPPPPNTARPRRTAITTPLLALPLAPLSRAFKTEIR